MLQGHSTFPKLRDGPSIPYFSPKENEKTLTLEERFAHLEQIVARMEDADVSLDEAFELYKKGLDEVKSANDMVQGMEKAMLVLNSDGQLEEF